MSNFLQEISSKIMDGVGNEVLGKILIVVIFLLVLLAIPVGISVLFPLFKSKLNHRTKVYLYAFSTGFFIVLSTFGFLREALEQAGEATAHSNYSEWGKYGYNIAVVFGGLVGGILFSFTLKFAISYRINKKLLHSKKLSLFIHDHSHEHGGEGHVHEHPAHIFSQEDSIELAEEALAEKISGKMKIIALALLLTHRIPEGFLIGYNLSLTVNGQEAAVTNLTLAYFISLILHMIPEELVFYYRLREAGYGRWNSLLISTIMDMLFLPFMLIGMFAGTSIASNPGAQGALMAIIAGIFLFTSLVEFFPEFYHVEMSKKRWMATIIALFIGVAFAVFVLCFHSHSHGHVHNCLVSTTLDLPKVQLPNLHTNLII
ncbi:ZIP family metal transporter [Mycoplasma hafezii]|uniref:ZIP family metal transporter n=1 Tax=Mycoplasma hafezii TaxID=525886 RepID=UPI003CF0D650